MRSKTIISLALFLCALASSACDRSASTAPGQKSVRGGAGVKSELYEQPVRLAVLEDRAVKESSGLAASRRNPGILWTHNDSGDGPYLYAFDRSGRSGGRWRVTGAKADDWEDIAAGPGPRPGVPYLYIGDTGDNSADRGHITVYRVAEPAVSVGADVDADGEGQLSTEDAEAIRLKYPDGRHDAEALMVHPATGDLYIVTKDFSSDSGVYKLKAPFDGESMRTLERVARISVPSLVGGLITGGDISPDGRRVVLCDYLNAYELTLADGAGSFDGVWGEEFKTIELGPRRQGEAVCYREDGLAILVTSEGRPAPLVEIKRKK